MIKDPWKPGVPAPTKRGGVRGAMPMGARARKKAPGPPRDLDEDEQKRLAQFGEWLNVQAPERNGGGLWNRFAYYVGRLAADRENGNPFADAIAALAWKAAMENRITLVQSRRRDGGGYEYIAMKKC